MTIETKVGMISCPIDLNFGLDARGQVVNKILQGIILFEYITHSTGGVKYFHVINLD